MKNTLQIITAVLVFSVAALFADPIGPMMMSGLDPIVAPDGTVLTLRSEGPSEPGTGPSPGDGMELIAVDRNGAIAWAYQAGGGIHDIVITNNLVIIAVTDGGAYGWWDGVDNEANSRIVALTLAAGTVAWTLDLDAVVRSLEATSDRIYAVSGMHGQSVGVVRRSTRHPGHGHGPGMGPGDGGGPNAGNQTLFAIGIDGTLLWSLPLND